MKITFSAAGDMLVQRRIPKESEGFKEIACPLDDYKKWLTQADFEIIDIYDEMTFNPLCDTTQRAVFVARYNGKAI